MEYQIEVRSKCNRGNAVTILTVCTGSACCTHQGFINDNGITFGKRDDQFILIIDGHASNAYTVFAILTIDAILAILTIDTVPAVLTISAILAVSAILSGRFHAGISRTDPPVAVGTNKGGIAVLTILTIDAVFAIFTVDAILAILTVDTVLAVSAILTCCLYASISRADPPVAVVADKWGVAILSILTVGTVFAILTIDAVPAVLAINAILAVSTHRLHAGRCPRQAVVDRDLPLIGDRIDLNLRADTIFALGTVSTVGTLFSGCLHAGAYPTVSAIRGYLPLVGLCVDPDLRSCAAGTCRADIFKLELRIIRKSYRHRAVIQRNILNANTLLALSSFFALQRSEPLFFRDCVCNQIFLNGDLVGRLAIRTLCAGFTLIALITFKA